MAKHEKDFKGKSTWVLWVFTESVSVKLPNNLGFQQNGFIVSFGLKGENFGQYVRNGKAIAKFNTEQEAADAGFAELEKL
jgi:hypothetical protein